MTKPNHPQIGRELLAHELIPDTVVWVTREDRKSFASLWVEMVTPEYVSVLAAFDPTREVHLLLRRNPDGTMCDDTGKRIYLFQYLGDIAMPEPKPADAPGGGVLLDRNDPRAPKYWMYETSGVLKPAIEAYLEGREMSASDVGAMRAYLRQWICSPVWEVGGEAGEELEKLRRDLNGIQTRDDITKWLHAALREGHDPL